MYAIICIFDFMNFTSFIIKFIKFKPIIKFKKVRTTQLWFLQLMGATNAHPKWHLDRFSRFAGLTPVAGRQTDKQPHNGTALRV